MLIENSFQVAADPDRVFDFLQDAHNVISCVPGAELVEDLGDDSYAGQVNITVGPVTTAYTGVAIITRRDPTARVAVLRAHGKDTTGNGCAKAVATLRVTPADTGSAVELTTELSLSGTLARFGRDTMTDASTTIVGDMANRVRAAVETADTPQPTTPTGIIRRLTDRLRGKLTT
jgi:uncharacterized protein